MSKIKITFGETEYTLPAMMNIGQLEKVADALKGDRVPFAILEIAMTRAEPKVHSVKDLEMTLPEITEAVDLILTSGGFREAAKRAETDAAAKVAVEAFADGSAERKIEAFMEAVEAGTSGGIAG